MKTFVVYPSVIKRATAYKQLDTGEIWGPFVAVHPENKGDSFWREPVLYTPAQDRGLKTTQSWLLAGTQLILRC